MVFYYVMYCALQQAPQLLCNFGPPSKGGTLSEVVEGLYEDVGEGSQGRVVQQGVGRGGKGRGSRGAGG